MKFSYPLQRTRVKICGLTRPEDARAAVMAGVDAIGLVFYPPSPRFVDTGRALDILDGLPPFVTVVGLFVNAGADEVRRVLDRVPLDLLQFHGDEDPAYCGSFGRPYIKALQMKPGIDLGRLRRDHCSARALLVDAWHPDARGGTGECFDWSLLPVELRGSLILAGGLMPENIREAIQAVRPYAVDVSSGVEAGRGIKDAGKMRAFLREVYEFDYGLRDD